MALAYALTVWSAMAGVAKSGGNQGRVGCSDRWSGARHGGLVLRWWLRHGGGIASVACVLGYDVRGTWRGL